MTRLARINYPKLPLKVCFDVSQKSRGVVTLKDTPSVWHLILWVRRTPLLTGAMFTLTQAVRRCGNSP